MPSLSLRYNALSSHPERGTVLLKMSSLPCSVQALLGCAGALVVGVVVMGDYGMGIDLRAQRWIAFQNLYFLLAPEVNLLPSGEDRYYGMAFEILLLLAEFALGSEHTGDIAFIRHLLTHLLFLAAALCCSLLTYRLFNNRLLAFIALLLFLLHPRLYAYSFFNSKDAPFISMFMICLYLTHKSFTKDTLGAFLILGVGVGVLVNLRIMGIVLFPAILTMRALDMLPASRRDYRGRGLHVAATGCVFIAASASMYYAVSPFLWTDPLASFTSLWETLSNHPANPMQMFQGNLIGSRNKPPHYIPTWIAITTPPATLLLMAIGAVVTCAHSLARPLQALQNTDLRFGILLIACLAMPIAAVLRKNPVVYDGWRHLYFLYVPMCLLAVTGLHWINATTHKLPGLWKTGGYFLTGMGMVATVVDMVLIHPHQTSYFNFLVDRHTPEYLRSQYEFDHKPNGCREGLVHLLQRYPHTTIKVRGRMHVDKDWHTLPKRDRERIILVSENENADFHLFCGSYLREESAYLQNESDAVFTRKVYNNTIVVVKSASCGSGEAIHRMRDNRLFPPGRGNWGGAGWPPPIRNGKPPLDRRNQPHAKA